MTASEILEFAGMQQGTASKSTIRYIYYGMNGESVPPEVMYEITGRPGQWGSLESALLAAGCRRDES